MSVPKACAAGVKRHRHRFTCWFALDTRYTRELGRGYPNFTTAGMFWLSRVLAATGVLLEETRGRP